MAQSLPQIAQSLRDANKKVQLIYAFNGTGKTRLSREFKELIAPKNPETEEEETGIKIMYYNAFTEDLFYWDNDLDNDEDRKLKIQPNTYTNWILQDQGQEPNIAAHFQRYTSDKLTPSFNDDFSEVRFSFERGDDSNSEFVKISKGEESCFIWSVFYSLLKEAIEALIPLGEAQEEIKSLAAIAESKSKDTKKAENLAKKSGNKEDAKKAEVLGKEAEVANIELSAAQEKLKNLGGLFNDLQYVFIDDPVSSLDDTHLIELAVNIAELIKSSNSGLKFIITTHNPLFYNVLFNEFNGVKNTMKWRLEKLDDGTFSINELVSDSPFSYHLFLLSELEKAIQSPNDIKKFHFNFLRNILEKTSTFLGHNKWEDLLPKESREAYYKRIINLSSHSKHHGEEISIIEENDKRVLSFLVEEVKRMYGFKSTIKPNVIEEDGTV
ncbi:MULTISPECIES: AAA family ATPase [Elizabethkingia]|uniref:AAA family ATPase n=1 Tax=Elizabethkingia TaxID=308865 RepID=UPI000741689C|nr:MULTISPECIES: AAA family ATPase [Elizabethkingia]KUG12939.1 anticodon nuclease [Elizabethkingia miricola]MCL1655527.1 AAA family ATPase [Elizabethkingia miricola]